MLCFVCDGEDLHVEGEACALEDAVEGPVVYFVLY